ncbi:ferredoxin [Propionigenium maris DSM 9537]|uniref:Ferredoxin n=1 Tax=Propionigenium maris DSM 9537 TaxID=1123000 RepID=A0A9W6GH15_9FUSO|nr:4Fe-4S binding protein [Propionigenium maris]GLI55103.1 ferredoxin [Propionigenium maris DSM 9537]
MSYRIDLDLCVACGACEPLCPVDCISEAAKGKRVIDEGTCIDCSACAGLCPVNCIAHIE